MCIRDRLLRTSGKELHYAEFYEKEKDQNVHEVDFILPRGRKILPIEVKSSVSSRHRSLDVFMERYSARVDEAVVIHSKNLRVDGKILYLPVYMTPLL